MGWCSGSYLAEDIWRLVKKHIPEKDKKKLARRIYDLFCDGDADCWENDMEIIKDAEINWDE